MFIQTEATSDPARLKFLLDREVLAKGTLDLRDKAEAVVSPLAERLFAIPGVSSVFFGRESIIVEKAGGDWRLLKPAVLGAIMEHFMSGAPILHEGTPGERRASAPIEKADAAHDIRDALRQVIDPELGYNIVDLGLIYDIAIEEGGIVHITMTTTTPGCPATSYLKQGAGEAASSVPGVELVDVTVTYEPRWTPEMMCDEAKAHFGIRERGRR